MNQIILDGERLTLEDVIAVAYTPTIEVMLADEALVKVRRAEQGVRELIERGEVVYGVTTGFGAFKDHIIPPDQLAQLQRNILMSHAVGVGEPLDEATTRAMMIIRANTLAKGYSGIREETLNLLLDMLNRGVYPLVPSQGSLGASGDLAPLAHLALPLIGLGEAVYAAPALRGREGELLPGDEALARAGNPHSQVYVFPATDHNILLTETGCIEERENRSAQGWRDYPSEYLALIEAWLTNLTKGIVNLRKSK